jgi:hypothetical protein
VQQVVAALTAGLVVAQPAAVEVEQLPEELAVATLAASVPLDQPQGRLAGLAMVLAAAAAAAAAVAAMGTGGWSAMLHDQS